MEGFQIQTFLLFIGSARAVKQIRGRYIGLYPRLKAYTTPVKRFTVGWLSCRGQLSSIITGSNDVGGLITPTRI